MSANLIRIHELTDLMASGEWVNAHFIINDDGCEGVVADCLFGDATHIILKWYMPAGSSMGLHVHEHSREILTCVEGEMPTRVGEQTHELKVGDSIIVDAGVPHGASRLFVEDSVIISITIPPAPEFVREGGDFGAKY